MKTVVALLKMGDRRFAKECGQGVMGFLIALPILLLLFRSLFIGAYLMGASLWLQHVNYELGICGLSNLKPAQCRHQARKQNQSVFACWSYTHPFCKAVFKIGSCATPFYSEQNIVFKKILP